jgi:hypothetical protein
MRTLNPAQVKLVEFHRRFGLAIEDRDLWRRPLRQSVHRWFQSPNITDLYVYRQPEDFMRIGVRLLGRGGMVQDAAKTQLCVVLPFRR